MVFFLALCFVGILKKWSLGIYGTSEQPYLTHHQRARSAEILMDGELTEEYNGQSGSLFSFAVHQLHAKCFGADISCVDVLINSFMNNSSVTDTMKL